MLEVNFPLLLLSVPSLPSTQNCAGQEAELQEAHSCTAGGEPVWWLCFVKLVFPHFTVALCQECTASLQESLLLYESRGFFLCADVCVRVYIFTLYRRSDAGNIMYIIRSRWEISQRISTSLFFNFCDVIVCKYKFNHVNSGEKKALMQETSGWSWNELETL